MLPSVRVCVRAVTRKGRIDSNANLSEEVVPHPSCTIFTQPFRVKYALQWIDKAYFYCNTRGGKTMAEDERMQLSGKLILSSS